MFSIFEKCDVSSANILHDDVISSGKSFIKIRNKRGCKTEPCETPAVILVLFISSLNEVLNFC